MTDAYPEFDLRERDAPGPRGTERARAALRRAYEVPVDTFITHDLPTLLTKLSQLPPTR